MKKLIFAMLMSAITLSAAGGLDFRAALSRFPALTDEPEKLGTRTDVPGYDAASYSLIQQQLSDIEHITKVPMRGDVTLLLPFVNYTTNPDLVLFYMTPETQENMAEIRSNWPVFAAILNNPYAKEELEAFAIDSRKPLEMRLEAWLVLRYVDQNAFQEVADRFNTEMATASSEVRRYITNVEKGNVEFTGVLPILSK